MLKIAGILMLALGLALAPSQQEPGEWRQECVQRCTAAGPTNSEMQRQEILSLEKEAAHAIQLNNPSFFQRVYSDDFAGTLSHGQQVNKSEWIAATQSPQVRYESFTVSDIKIRIFQNTAIATCLWSSRSMIRNQHVSSQLRATHVYVYSPGGWRVVSGQATNLPPDVEQPL